MKTTLEIADALLTEAKRAARRRGIPLRRLVEDGLRRILEEPRKQPFKLRDGSVDGGWLRPEIEQLSGAELRALAYDEGRGG